MSEILDRLAQRRGIGTEYTDIWGVTTQTSNKTKQEILAAMGYPVADEQALEQDLRREEAAEWQRILPPVCIWQASDAKMVTIHLPDVLQRPQIPWRITLEPGVSPLSHVPLQGSVSLSECAVCGHYQSDTGSIHAYTLNLPLADLPCGYHQLSLFAADDVASAVTTLIVAPDRCYSPLDDEEKCWGASIQLYCLRSRRNWGVGDFSDLKSVLQGLAGWGAQFVGLNPIHALYSANPDSCSPYSPSSRRWLNTIYIDVEAIPEFKQTPALQQALSAEAVQAELQRLRAVDWVDYPAVFALKRHWLRQVFAHLDTKSARGQAFASFIADGGEGLLQIATFDALHQYLYDQGIKAWGPPVWPHEYKHYHDPAVQVWAEQHSEDIHFYQYLQWIAAEQLAEVQSLANELKMRIGLYRDLAVGVSEGACEIWANAQWYCVQASIGAPPDPLGPQGQNWGLPPLDPHLIQEQAYAPFIRLLQANMQSCGALRIDHVMGLCRLWWVPPRENAAHGAYVYYPFKDMMAILALESQRQRCMVIGEDLGTVPPDVRDVLKQSGVYSYKVFFFERAPDGGYFSPKHYLAQSMAALTTHDMPTLRGYWHCDDLALGRKLGLYPDDNKLQDLYRERHSAKQAIINSLDSHQLLPEGTGKDVNWVGMNRPLAFALQEHLCRGNAALFSTQLEDWLEMDHPVNIPGTSHEYPNWRRKLSKNLEDFLSDQELAKLAVRLTEARKAR
jgi:4-alpha-glucanotransferase